MSLQERILEKLTQRLGRPPTADEIWNFINGSGLLSDKEFEQSVEQARKEIEQDVAYHEFLRGIDEH
jgi:hypothetical protein